MQTKLFRLGVLLAAILVISAGGCGGPTPPTLVTAAGEVMFKDKPLTAGSIIFFPDKSVEYQDDNPTSLLQVDGSFTMKTFPFGDGVSPGKYKVCLSRALAGAIQFPDYADPKKTPWEVEIPETGETDIVLKVQ